MDGWFASNNPWDVQLKHPVTDAVATVWLRELNSADQAMLDDLLSASDEGEALLKLGTRDLMKVQRQVVRWEGVTDATGNNVTCTPATIAALPPAVFEQLLEKVEAGRPVPTIPGPDPEPETVESDSNVS